MGLSVRMLVGLDWLALGEPSPGSNAQGHPTRGWGGGGGHYSFGGECQLKPIALIILFAPFII